MLSDERLDEPLATIDRPLPPGGSMGVTRRYDVEGYASYSVRITIPTPSDT